MLAAKLTSVVCVRMARRGGALNQARSVSASSLLFYRSKGPAPAVKSNNGSLTTKAALSSSPGVVFVR
jgi:hypothetical protein